MNLSLGGLAVILSEEGMAQNDCDIKRNAMQKTSPEDNLSKKATFSGLISLS